MRDRKRPRCNSGYLHDSKIPPKVVEFVDEAGWCPCKEDLANNFVILGAFLLHTPDFIPAIGFIALVLMAANAILSGKVLNKPETVEAMKCRRFLFSCLQFSHSHSHRIQLQVTVTVTGYSYRIQATATVIDTITGYKIQDTVTNAVTIAGYMIQVSGERCTPAR